MLEGHFEGMHRVRYLLLADGPTKKHLKSYAIKNLNTCTNNNVGQ